MDLKERPEQGFTRHPWELARYAFFRRLIEGSRTGNAPISVLDVGAGDAWFSSRLIPSLANGSHATCWDVGYDEAELPPAFADSHLVATRKRPDERFDLVMLLDVAEHVEDDRAFVSEIVQSCLKPDGVLLFSVPAWAALTTARDLALGHHRRYSPAQVRGLIQASGLRIVRCGGLFHSLTIPRGFSALAEKFRGAPETPEAGNLEWKGGALLGRVVGAALALDGLVSRLAARAGMEVPGLSWWALCQSAAEQPPTLVTEVDL
jgi:SAM-dependent methyltransferase